MKENDFGLPFAVLISFDEYKEIYFCVCVLLKFIPLVFVIH